MSQRRRSGSPNINMDAVHLFYYKCPLCTARSPWVRLRHFNEIADQLFYYTGRFQVEYRDVEVGDVVVASLSQPSWDNMGVVVQVRGFGDYEVWTPCGYVVNWWSMSVRNYGRALGYDDELPAF